MTNYAVTTLPGGNDFATVLARGDGLSPRDTTVRASAIIRTTLTIAVSAPSAINRDATRRADCKRILRNSEVSHSAPFKA